MPIRSFSQLLYKQPWYVLYILTDLDPRSSQGLGHESSHVTNEAKLLIIIT